MRAVFSVKEIPRLAWSSPTPLNLRPERRTLFYLVMGLVLFGLGESLLIASGAGVSPWTVLAQGLADKTALSVGFSTMVLSFLVLLLWVPLAQKPGIGTIANAVIIAIVIDLSLPVLPTPETIGWQLLQSAAGVFIVGVSSAIYLTANLGPGPRDGLMTGLQAVSGLPIAGIRVAIEVTVVAVGWYLGGVVGIGSLLFAFGVGPCVAVGIVLVRRYL